METTYYPLTLPLRISTGGQVQSGSPYTAEKLAASGITITEKPGVNNKDQVTIYRRGTGSDSIHLAEVTRNLEDPPCTITRCIEPLSGDKTREDVTQCLGHAYSQTVNQIANNPELFPVGADDYGNARNTKLVPTIEYPAGQLNQSIEPIVVSLRGIAESPQLSGYIADI